jgi:hypothetical protein
MPDDLPVNTPVFVDLTGRRRRGVRMAAIIGAGLLIGIVALVVAALLGAPIGPLTSLPEPAPPPSNAVAPNPEAPGAGPDGNPASTTTPNPARQAGGPAGAGTTTTTVPNPANPTTTAPKGSKPESAPGRPTDLPPPPGHTR